ncbi:MAG TPA: roadblock/LC7 domain-containing protein [Longimicrobiaceae bacterium]|jgi:predicted regulator of Ras-like GTPase activity (Roadblock/LC7/MglB family)|nr:roadblock/LC7 domain-containing protein [Longimicrobiaceae bacterium]
MSAYAELLASVNAVRGVRGSMIVAAEDGLVVEEDLMIGVPGEAVAALVASLFRRARRSVQAADFGGASFLQVEGDDGLLFAAAPPQLGDLLLVVVAESWVNVGLVRLEAARVAGALG